MPSSFRVLRQLLDRIEDSVTGEIKLPELNTEIPADRLAETTEAASLIAGELRKGMPFAGGTRPVDRGEVPEAAIHLLRLRAGFSAAACSKARAMRW